MKFKKYVVAAVVALLSIAMIGEDSFARRGGSFGGSRSSGARSSRSSGSFRSSRSRSSSSSRSSSRSTRSAASSKKAAQRKAYEKAKASGKAFKTKGAALKSYRAKVKNDPKVKAEFSKKFPTRYSKQPSSRPSHIPQKYQGHTVIYQNGGYGYTNSSGVFTMLTAAMLMNTMSDAMLVSHMKTQGYHIGAAPPKPVSGWVIFWWVFGSIFVILVVVGAVALLRP